MKKIVLLFILACQSLSANASSRVDFELMTPPEVEITRNYFNFDYTELHGRTTMDGQDAEAYFEGALRYYYGYSKRLDVPYPKDYAAAAKWFYKAGMLNHKESAYFLGEMYLKGQGVKVDYKAAFWWLNKSYSLGLKQAGLKLGNLYYKNYKKNNLAKTFNDTALNKAQYYWSDLAKQSYPYALYNLAVSKIILDPKDRFVRKEVSKLLNESFYSLIKIKDKDNLLKILKLIQYYNLEGYKDYKRIFNNL